MVTNSGPAEVFKYFKDVLGVSQILLGPSPNVEIESEQASPVQPKILFIEDQSHMTEASQELFDKILQAMKLDQGQYLFWGTTLEELVRNKEQLNQFQVLICFSPAMAEWLKNHPFSNSILLIETASPSKMLVNPSLKKKAWDDFKRAMAHLEHNSV